MGSSGSGNFSDYPSGKKGSGDSDGAPGANDRCGKAFSVTLEDIQQSEYYKKHGKSPGAGTELGVTLKKRVVAITTTGEVVGNLPTTFNYLAGCLTAGFSYVGKITSSKDSAATSSVAADFAPVG